MDITIKTGVEHYKIRDEKKNIIAEFDLNPGDINVARRYDEIAEKLRKYEIPDTNDARADVENAESYLMERFDYLLGYNASKEIFGRYSPLVPLVSGTFFFQELIGVIGTLVRDGIRKRTGEIENQVEKTLKDLNEK